MFQHFNSKISCTKRSKTRADDDVKYSVMNKNIDSPHFHKAFYTGITKISMNCASVWLSLSVCIKRDNFHPQIVRYRMVTKRRFFHSDIKPTFDITILQ